MGFLIFGDGLETSYDEFFKIGDEKLKRGTNFQAALGKGMEVIQHSSFQHADIVFVTDGEASVSDDFLRSFHDKKQNKAFNVLSLIIGRNSNTNTVNQFSDKR